MRLAFSLYRYFPHGGLQRDMLAIARACEQRGHSVKIFCHEWNADLDASVDVQLVAAKGLTNATKMKNFAAEVDKQLNDEEVDLVVGFNKMPGLNVYYAADTSFAYKAKYERDELYRMAPRTKAYIKAEAAVFGEHSSTEILEISRAEREKFVCCHGTPEHRFHSLPPGISRSRVMPDNHQQVRAASRAALGLNEQTKVLLALGSGFRSKGVDRSIKALAAVLASGNGGAELLVVGNDSAGEFQKLAKQLGIGKQVRFLGGRDDVPALMQAADLLIHPAYKENTDGVLLEAAVAGLPVVATDVCGYAHYITEHGLGEVVATPFLQNLLNDSVERVLAESRTHWQLSGQKFSKHDEIYSMPAKAAEIIEQIGVERGRY